jgi:hypothetical protein
MVLVVLKFVDIHYAYVHHGNLVVLPPLNLHLFSADEYQNSTMSLG